MHGYGHRLRQRLAGGGVSAPSFAISSEFPALKTAYEGGDRALISLIGDSTTANLGGGSSVAGALIGDADTTSTSAYLRDFIAGKGLQALTGTFMSGDHGFAYSNGLNPSQWGQFYSPDATFDASFGYFGAVTPWGFNTPYSSSAGDKVRWTPGFAYDRVEGLHLTFGGAGAFTVKLGSTTIDTVDANVSASITKRSVVNVSLTSSPIDQVVSAGQAWPGALRVWNSALGGQVQVENLGNSSWMASDWLRTGAGYEPGFGIAHLGSHLFIINLGLNEAFNGVAVATAKANLKTLINSLLGTGANVLVCIPTKGTGSFDLSSDRRTAIVEACSECGIGVPVDLYNLANWNTGTDLSDVVHPNAGGNYKMVNGVSGLGGIGARLLGLS